MPVEALIAGAKVKYESGEWSTDDKSLLEVLPLYEQSYWVVDGNYTPDRDLAIMQYILEITGGKITKHTPPELVNGTIY